MKETIASKNEDSILCHNISNEDGNDSENEEFSVSMMQLNEKYFTFQLLLNNIIILIIMIHYKLLFFML